MQSFRTNSIAVPKHILNPIYNSKLPVSSSASYSRFYLILKGNQSILETVLAEISQKTSNKCLNQIISIINEVLHTTYGFLLKTIQKCTADLQSLLIDNSVDKSNKNIAKRVMSSLLSIMNQFSSVINYHQFESPKEQNEKEEIQTDNIPKLSSSSQDTVICRICDQTVPLDFLEEHTKSCVLAYQSEERLSRINKSLQEVLDNLQDTALNSPWPGNKDQALTFLLPIFHASLIINSAIDIDIYIQDSADVFENLFNTFSFSNFYSLMNSQFSSLFTNAKLYLLEKKHVCNAIREANNVLRLTNLSGRYSRSLTEVTIADFTFLKKISSGAYARVFLAKKNVTGDIFAIKVQPKSEIQRKNQAKRIITEKNILLSFNHQYIVKFCMYLSIFLSAFSNYFNTFQMILLKFEIIQIQSYGIELKIICKLCLIEKLLNNKTNPQSILLLASKIYTSLWNIFQAVIFTHYYQKLAV